MIELIWMRRELRELDRLANECDARKCRFLAHSLRRERDTYARQIERAERAMDNTQRTMDQHGRRA